MCNRQWRRCNWRDYGGGGRMGLCSFPRPHRGPRFPRGAGPRAGKTLSTRLSLARSSHYYDACERASPVTRASAVRLASRGENSELGPGPAAPVRGPVVGAGMVPALALLLLALAPLGPAAARRHAPDLREDEPARRTTRPAGKLYVNSLHSKAI
ncbi:unnamed protein product [Colias eurytheme]|nr:unnamed protein product [Colias eurytheme]